MAKTVAMNGNEAVAQAVKQINPDVVAAYPITPSTAIVEYVSQYVADGLIDTEFITVESEHSSLSACLGAAAAGGRVINATSSQGLALMWEVLFAVSGMRLPITLAVVNRALSAPINIHSDHSDAMGARDSGWIQIYSENCQEAYDNMIQAILISEHMDVRTPIMVNLDGFIISHSVETFTMEDDDTVKNFLGEYKAHNPLLDVKKPVTYGAIAFQDYYFEHKRSQLEGLQNASKVIETVGKEYGKLTGREYGLFEEYKVDDADYVIVVMSSAAGTTKVVVDKLRKQNKKVGLLKLRLFRPFPSKEVASVLKGKKAVAILDRCGTGGAQNGPLALEIKSCLYGTDNAPTLQNYIFGLGGRELDMGHITSVFKKLEQSTGNNEAENNVEYLNLRG